MAINKDGWLDYATIAPGIPDKVYSAPNKIEGIVMHSVVGTYQGAIARFMDETRYANGQYTSYAAASVHFIITYWGELIQMYPITASCWASGTYDANTRYVAVEMEGGYASNPSEPLNELQIMAMFRLVRELEAFKGQTWYVGQQLREHNEFQSTACPSQRYENFKIAWVMEQEAKDSAQQEILMTPEERLLLNQVANILIRNGYKATLRADMPEAVKMMFPPGSPVGTTVNFTDDKAVAFATLMGLSFAQGIANTQSVVTTLGARVAKAEQALATQAVALKELDGHDHPHGHGPAVPLSA